MNIEESWRHEETCCHSNSNEKLSAKSNVKRKTNNNDNDNNNGASHVIVVRDFGWQTIVRVSLSVPLNWPQLSKNVVYSISVTFFFF